MTDALLVLRKLTVLREHLGRVRRRRPTELAAFVADVDLQDATAMSLLVAIQEAVDIAMHLASDEGWGVPQSYGTAFDLLADNAVIDQAHARDLGAAASLRNRMTHGYVSVDLERLYGEIPAGLATLERFAVAIARHVAAAAGPDQA